MLTADAPVHLWAADTPDRNDLALEAARLYPDRFAVIGRLAVEKRG